MSPRSIPTPRPIVEEVVANEVGSVVGPPVSSVDALQIVTPTAAGPKVPLKPKPVHLHMEPGRYLVSEGGVLVTNVTQIRQKRNHRFVGVATGMNTLIRPALYNAWHDIVNITFAKKTEYNVVPADNYYEKYVQNFWISEDPYFEICKSGNPTILIFGFPGIRIPGTSYFRKS